MSWLWVDVFVTPGRGGWEPGGLGLSAPREVCEGRVGSWCSLTRGSHWCPCPWLSVFRHQCHHWTGCRLGHRCHEKTSRNTLTSPDRQDPVWDGWMRLPCVCPHSYWPHSSSWRVCGLKVRSHGQWVREELWTTPQRPLTLGSLVHLVLQGSLY